VRFNFDDADIYEVIQTIFGDVLKVNYLVDPRVKGRVTFRSVAPVAREDVLPLMEVILRLNGVGVVEEGGLYRIIPIGDLPKEPATIEIGREADKIHVTGTARVQVVPLQYTSSGDMIRILTPFLSANAEIIDVPTSNRIVIVDTDDNIKKLLKLVDLFDSDLAKQARPQVFVYPVQNGKAKDVVNILQQIFQGAKAPQVTKPPTSVVPRAGARLGATPMPQAASQPQINTPASNTQTVLSDVTKIVADETTNSIIVFGPPEDYELIADTIRKIDIAPRQVSIEGLVVEVTLTDNLDFGLSWSMKHDINISGIKPFTNGIDLNGTSSLNPGGLTAPLPTNGFTFVGVDPTNTVRAVFTALQDRTKAKVVAAPHILVSDNHEARIQIGQQIPIATSTSAQPVGGISTETTSIPVVGTSTIEYKDIGIILKVKPQVNDSGLITVELSQEISSLGQPVDVGGLAESSINKTEATSQLVAQDGEPIVIGGLIREDNTHETTGLPFLSRIPIIGSLFGNTTNSTQRTELIILLTPHVMRNQHEAQGVTSGYIERYKQATKDNELDRLMKEGDAKEQGKNNNQGGQTPEKNAP
jgi:general secretion pathway protein D